MDICILKVEKPNCFWAREVASVFNTSNGAADFLILCKDMQEYFLHASKKTPNLVIGECYIVRNPITKRWCRASLQSVSHSNHGYQATCYLLDYASTVSIPEAWIREAPRDFLKLPCQAKKFILYGLVPLTFVTSLETFETKRQPSSKWDRAATDYVKRIITENNCGKAEILDYNDGCFYAKIYLKKCGEFFCLNDDLVAQKFATLKLPETSNNDDSDKNFNEFNLPSLVVNQGVKKLLSKNVQNWQKIELQAIFDEEAQDSCSSESTSSPVPARRLAQKFALKLPETSNNDYSEKNNNGFNLPLRVVDQEVRLESKNILRNWQKNEVQAIFDEQAQDSCSSESTNSPVPPRNLVSSIPNHIKKDLPRGENGSSNLFNSYNKNESVLESSCSETTVRDNSPLHSKISIGRGAYSPVFLCPKPYQESYPKTRYLDNSLHSKISIGRGAFSPVLSPKPSRESYPEIVPLDNLPLHSKISIGRGAFSPVLSPKPFEESYPDLMPLDNSSLHSKISIGRGAFSPVLSPKPFQESYPELMSLDNSELHSKISIGRGAFSPVLSSKSSREPSAVKSKPLSKKMAILEYSKFMENYKISISTVNCEQNSNDSKLVDITKIYR